MLPREDILSEWTVTLERIDAAILVIGSCWLIGLLGRWATHGRRDPLRHAPSRPNRLTPDLVLIPVLLWMAGLYAAEELANLTLGDAPSSPPWATDEVRSLISMTTAQVLGAIGCLLVGRRCFAGGWSGFGLSGHGLGRRAVYGALALLAIWPVLYGTHAGTVLVLTMLNPEFTPPAHQILTTLDAETTPPWVWPCLWLSAVVIAPLAEELFFRGVIQTSLTHYYAPRNYAPRIRRPGSAPSNAPVEEQQGSSESATVQGAAEESAEKSIGESAGTIAASVPTDDFRSRWLPILVTACVFGMIHFPQPQAVPTLILFALGMGYVYHRTGSLIPSMTMHVLFNLKTMVFHTLISMAVS